MNTPTTSIRVLLSEIIDYAGLFPPSKLSMAAAVANYAEYLTSEHSWMLGRFIVPVANLDKFSKEAAKFLETDQIWRLSAITGDDTVSDLKKISRFNAKNRGKAIIETVEIKATLTTDINNISKTLPEDLTAYFEFPQTEVLTDFMTALAISKSRAKIRTGGITQEAFPSTDAIIKFMRICIAANVPFKATAGLHHPLRCTKPLTYEDNAPKGMMHGFLNLFLSGVFLRQDLNNSFVHKVMNEVVIDDFQFEDDRIMWQDHSVEVKLLELFRKRNAISFGSCSFTEPVEELKALGLL